MIKDETENHRHLSRVCFYERYLAFPQVIRVRLELTTNDLKDHCYDVPTSDIIELTGTPV